MKKLLLIGGGGHCRSVLDSILTLNSYEKIGIIDNEKKSLLDIPIIGTDDDLVRLFYEGWTDAFITVGSVGNSVLRNQLYQMVLDIGFTIPTIIDPTSIISRDVTIQQGVFIGKKVVVNTGSLIEACSILNTGCIVEHDCIVKKFAHISPGTILCGQVQVGKNTHVGAGSVVRQLIKIGANSLIGSGSVVVKDIPDNVTAYGNPCRVVK